jgi:hypothetical protein
VLGIRDPGGCFLLARRVRITSTIVTTTIDSIPEASVTYCPQQTTIGQLAVGKIA